MNPSSSKKLFNLCIFLACTTFLSAQQGSVEEFGKNRVQYHDDFNQWDRYESQNFITHWYGKGRKIAKAVVQYAEYENESIRSLLEHRTNEKSEIIVYTDVTDLHQTNIGNNEVFATTPGEVNVLGNKLFVYFDGNQQHLRKQIREGITKVYLTQMLFGESWQQFFQNIGHEDYPEWYLKGIVEYVESRWDLEHDNIARDVIYHGPYEDFYALAEDHPKLAGRMFWFFLSRQYGESILANVLYLNRINRKIDNAFLYTLNESLDALIRQCWQFYQSIYDRDLRNMEMPADSLQAPFENKFCSSITRVRYNPNGESIAYITNELGEWKLRLQSLESDESDVLIKGSYRNPFQITDKNYPIFEWSKDGSQLIVIYERRDEIKIAVIEENGEVVMKDLIAPPFERIYDFDIVDNNTLVFSANAGGFVDLFHYFLDTRQMKRLTYDYFDDLDVSVGYWRGESGYFFTSNRTNLKTFRQLRDTTLVEENLNLYFLPSSTIEDDTADVIQITDTKFNHLDPSYRNGNVYYLEENRGRRYLSRITQTGNSEIVSDWRSNILTYDVESDKVGIVLFNKGRESLYYGIEPEEKRRSDVYTTIFATSIHDHLDFSQVESREEGKSTEEESKPLIFQSEFSDPENIPSFRNIEVEEERSLNEIDNFLSDRENSTKEVIDFKSYRVVASRLHFMTDGLELDFDNQPLYTGLNSYAGMKQNMVYRNPFGLLVKARVYDVFEDYVLEGGARFPTSLNGSEYFLTFKDKKRRWDKIYGFYRKSQRLSEGDQQGMTGGIQERFVNYIGTYEMRYPFNMFHSIRLRATFRQDIQSTLATEQPTLETPDVNTQRLGLRAEYVFDNTYDMAYNMKSGMRYKVYVEGLNKFGIQFSPWNFDFHTGFMTVAGFDARKYIRFGNHAMLGLRAAGATSFGSEQILFIMGGTDNEFFPGYNDLSRPAEGNFPYRGIAANMRGFQQNVRNGSTYALGNIELRVAPFNYFSKRELRSTFLRTFQIVGFFDTGTAWYGISPYSDKNPLNKITVSNSASEVEARYYRDPLIAGFGGGIRLTLFGMYFKADYGWGLDTKRIGDPRLHLSMGKDF